MCQFYGGCCSVELYAANIVTSVKCHLSTFYSPVLHNQFSYKCVFSWNARKVIDRNCAAKMNFHTFLLFVWFLLLCWLCESFLATHKYHFAVSSNKQCDVDPVSYLRCSPADYHFTYFSVYKRNVIHTHRENCVKIFSGNSKYFHMACF